MDRNKGQQKDRDLRGACMIDPEKITVSIYRSDYRILIAIAKKEDLRDLKNHHSIKQAVHFLMSGDFPQSKRIQEEIDHLNKKIAILEKENENDGVDPIDAHEDLQNWYGWRDALSWVLKGCKGNPHKGDGYE